MPEKFDVKKYKNEATKPTLSSSQKSIIIAKMYQADNDMKNVQKNRTRKVFYTKAIAAAIAVAILSGVAFWGIKGANAPRNSFTITANAASSTPDEKYTDITKGYSDGAMSGAFMESDNSVHRKDGFRDYFAEYFAENLEIKGTNIKSYSIRSMKKGVYFDLFPVEKVRDYIDKEKALADFSGKDTLNNSQYTREEFNKYAGYLNWVCDGFSHDNKTVTGEEQVVTPNNYLYIILESNHSDPEIAQWITEMESLHPNEKSDYEQYSQLERKIQKKTLENAKITVTVTYTDNTRETKIINLVYKGYKDLEFDVQ